MISSHTRANTSVPCLITPLTAGVIEGPFYWHHGWDMRKWLHLQWDVITYLCLNPNGGLFKLSHLASLSAVYVKDYPGYH